MVRQRKEKGSDYQLKQPDRSGPDPSQESLLQLAEKHGLFKNEQSRQSELDKSVQTQNMTRGVGYGDVVGVEEEALVGRFGDAMLWSTSLTMLHFTLDVLVTHQYAVGIVWSKLFLRSAQAFPIILTLFYASHPHPSPPLFLPRVPARYQIALHQLLFFCTSITAGSYLIHITNKQGYYANMKRAPPLGTIWIWSVIELNILWAVPSLICCALFLKIGGYSFL